MRLIGFLVLAALAIVPSASRADGIVVSSFACPPAIVCDSSEASFPTDAQLMALGTACVTRNISTVAGVAPFQTSGLDANGCLTTNLDAFPTGAKTTSTPQCCVKKTPRGSCMLTCDVIAH